MSLDLLDMMEIDFKRSTVSCLQDCSAKNKSVSKILWVSEYTGKVQSRNFQSLAKTMDHHKLIKTGRVLNELAAICFSVHFACDSAYGSFVQSLGNRTREFCKTERNFEAIGASPFNVQWKS